MEQMTKLTRDERFAAGKALRGSCPRVAHAGWKPAPDRMDRQRHQGKRVVEGQKIMQSVHDQLLGWTGTGAYV